MTNIRRISADRLNARMQEDSLLILLDVRRTEAFRRYPQGIESAFPVMLDEYELLLPDLPRDTSIIVYCLCSGQASSTRVAIKLLAAGYQDVAVLEGGLPQWIDQGFPLSSVDISSRIRVTWMSAPKANTASGGTSLLAESAFLLGETFPLQRSMAVLFVDMVNSTRLLFSHPPEEVLRLVQLFMQSVVDVAVQHCGDVHDFEGDGAMLYFAGAGESVPAAFELRRALQAQREQEPNLPQARFALDAGQLVVGYIGTRERQSLAFIGPCVNAAARILKLAPPGGIVATQTVVEHAQRTDPDHAETFHALPEKQLLKGFDVPVSVYLSSSTWPDKTHKF